MLAGVLDCGVAYYMRPVTRPAKSLELRLVVKTGSLCESESQRGYAHLLEHLGRKLILVKVVKLVC